MRIFKGTVVTCDDHDRVADVLVEDRGRIHYIGDEPPAEFREAEVVDLGGGALLPCFGDGHLHFSNWALVAAAFFDVREAGNFQEMGDMIRDAAARDRKSRILAAFGASRHSVAEGRLINRRELDRILPDRPFYLICYDGHSAIANTRLLEMFPKDLPGLRGFETESGRLFQEAYFKATDFVSGSIPPLTMVRSIIQGYDRLAEKGIGLIHPVEGIGFPRDLDVTLVDWIARARARKNGFQTRIFFQTLDVGKVRRRKLPRIGGCFAAALDGCFGVCDAALHEPYTHMPDNNGILFYSDEEVTRFAVEANRAGLQIEMHAIGDAAVDQAVRALAAALEDYPRKDHRHTLIHACLISPRTLDRCAELGIGITLQPAFLASPLEPLSYLEEILGPRARSGSPFRDIVERGIHLSGGSDAPVTFPDPIAGIHAACNHPYDPAQSLTIPQALRMFTREVAWTSFDERERGSLEPGKIADMVVLDGNPLAMKPEHLDKLKVRALYLSGREYSPGMGIAGAFRNMIRGRRVRR